MLCTCHESKHFLFVCMNKPYRQVIPGFAAYHTLLYFNRSVGCSTEPLKSVWEEQFDGNTLHLSLVSSASDAWLWQLMILTWAFHPPLDHTTGDMASHLRRPTSTSLHQSNYRMLSTKIFTPPWWSCSPRGQVKDAATAYSKSKKPQTKQHLN